MPEPKRPLKVFLCHAHADRDAVRALYNRLVKDGVDAWFDKEKLLPGQDWELEIRKAVREADVVVVCLSKQFNQAGFRQKEVRLALDTAMEKPEGEIFIIPAKLEECKTLESLRRWHEVNLFEEDGGEKLMRALRERTKNLQPFDETGEKGFGHSELAESNISKPDLPEFPSSNLNWDFVDGSVIFDERLRDAFPGLRGIEKFEGKEAVNRLKTLLRQPLKASTSGGSQVTPFWWFRGIANMHIEEFKQLSNNRILMNVSDLKIDHIVAVRKFHAKIKNFVYVQTLPDEPTGLYKYTENWLSEILKHNLKEEFGYFYYEEYGLWGDKLITREEFDDGATVIDGKPVPIIGALLRERYITPYNFVICSNDNVLNSGLVDWDATKVLDEILLGEKNVEGLIDFVGNLPKTNSWKS